MNSVIFFFFCDIKSYLFTFMHLTGMTHPSDDSFYSIFIEIAANLSISGGKMQEDIKSLIITDC